MELEKLAQNPLKNLRENSPQMPQFIGLEKLTVESQIGLSVDRPVDRPTVRNLTVVPAIDRPVDRGLDTESRLSVRSTGAFQRAEALCGRPGRSTGPPARTGVHVCARRSTDSVDRLQARSTGPVDRQKPVQKIWD